MRLLALDTATEACSVALAVDGAVLERYAVAPREHGDRLLGMIDEVLAEGECGATDLDAIAFGRGPGAFTGVRIAVSAVQGIAFGLDLPVLPVSDLVALAQGAYREHGVRRVLPAIDARMNEVYWGPCTVGDDGVAVTTGEELVCAPDAVPLPGGDDWYGCGTGWVTWGEVLAGHIGPALAGDLGHALPRAADLLPAARAAWLAGGAVPIDEAVPVYLRDRVAEKPRG